MNRTKRYNLELKVLDKFFNFLLVCSKLLFLINSLKIKRDAVTPLLIKTHNNCFTEQFACATLSC